MTVSVQCLTMGHLQLWDELLKTIPVPGFTRQSVYHLWQEESSKKWKHDQDELKSAQKIIKEASSSSNLCAVESIPLHDEPGFTAVAFSLPKVLEDGGGWEALAVTTTSKRLRANSAQNHGEHPSNKRTRRQDTPASAVPENIPENAAQTSGANHNHDVIDLTLSSPMASPRPSQVPAPVENEAGFSDSSGFDYGTGDEHEVSILQQITVLGVLISNIFIVYLLA